MDAMRILMDEHQSLAAIIHAIRHMIGEIGAGRLQPDHKLLEAMVHYLDAYPEKRHHPKEDEFLFGPLRARTHDADAALDKLEAEHADAEARIAVLEAAVKGYAQDAANFEAFKTAFNAYAEFYRTHMMTEEREVLPLIRKHFTAEDWERANAHQLISTSMRAPAKSAFDPKATDLNFFFSHSPDTITEGGLVDA